MRVVALAAACLAGCAGQYHSLDATPLRDRLSELQPGITTRDEVRALLGAPWYTADPWQAEIYAGSSIYREFVAIGLPIPAGQRPAPATVLVVYGVGDRVSGIEYFGAGKDGDCADRCRKGDLRGLEVQSLDLLLSPPISGADAEGWEPAPGQCLVIIDAPANTLRIPSGAWAYLDDRFLQRMPSTATHGIYRVTVAPGGHTLACRSVHVQPEPLPEPGHALVRERRWDAAAETYDFECPAGAVRPFRLVNLRASGIGFERCAFEPLDAAPPLEGAREIFVPAAGP